MPFLPKLRKHFRRIPEQVAEKWITTLRNQQNSLRHAFLSVYQSISLSEISIKSYHFNANEHWS